jgi:hypothetical protein
VNQPVMAGARVIRSPHRALAGNLGGWPRPGCQGSPG